MSAKLTFEQRAGRDAFVFYILNTVGYCILHRDKRQIPGWNIEDWETTAKRMGLSEAAISQTIEEVRQVLNLMVKLNKKRVP